MTQWPEPRKGIPEGHYVFRLNKEPELKKITAGGRESRSLLIYVIGINSKGEFQHQESFVPWDPRYADLCAALGVEHGRDIQTEGALFEADVEYEQSKKEPDKSYARMKNITPKGEGAAKPDDEDDIPF